MLELSGVRKIFHKGTPDEREVLRGISLSLAEGDFATVVGGNGAGKSTLFNVIAGNLLPDGGHITLGGIDITFMQEHRRMAYIGRMFQDPLMGTAPNMTVEENLAIAYMRSSRKNMLFGMSKADRLMLRERVASLGIGLEDRMRTRMGLLSGGQRQAVTLIMATISHPKLLLLDEHTAALDPVNTKRVLELTQSIVAEHKITTMMITHNLSTALSFGNRTLMLDEGQIALDLKQQERENLTTEGLLERFHQERHKVFDNDRNLL